MKIETNYVLKNIMVNAILKARILSTPEELDALIDTTLEQFQRANTSQDELLTERQVSKRWPFLDVRKLRNMRYLERGPTYYKFGGGRNGRIFYKPSDIEKWIAEHEQLEPMLKRELQTKVNHSLAQVRP
ncbi:hypothetical protein SCOR_27560 [Sulfidibacter corallicola]|uniref:Helix-turn-helix domain-containing protein n=1 Tax=Sulfidibacter corallicola TaxID=2818388 RepID=A0A8A4TL51_SULCO|nr:hypothetical protein [Sulfidibacter corallicola]QTD50686.1 hypothetical protein J3U87_34300 [Sulfidibacter corallicola]